MKRKSILTAILTAGLFAFSPVMLDSCGGGGGGTSSGTSGGTGGGTGGSGTVNQASTNDVIPKTNLGENLYRTLQESISISGAPIFFPAMPTGISPLSISKQQTNNPCTANTSGNLTDIDDDGIPVNATYDFTCNYSYNNIAITWQGKISAKDNNDNDPLSGYDLCTGVFNNGCSREPINTSGPYGSLDFIFDVNLDGNPTIGYTFTTFYYQWQLTNNSNNTGTATMESNNLTYDPDADGNNDPWDKGIWNGNINFSGSDNKGNSGSFTMTLTNWHVGICSGGGATGQLQLTGNCPAGNQTFQFNFTINLTSCNNGNISGTTCDGQSFSYSW